MTDKIGSCRAIYFGTHIWDPAWRKYSVRALINKIVSRDDFLKGVGRERVDTGKVGDDNAVMLFELTFLFFNRNAGPVTNILI